MIRILVLYPKGEATTFDTNYWTTTHMPMLSTAWPTCTWEADVCADDSPYYAVAHIKFASKDEMGAAMGGPGTGQVMGDITNYTNVSPVMSINEVAGTSS